jgi:hypothetical protein
MAVGELFKVFQLSWDLSDIFMRSGKGIMTHTD